MGNSKLETENRDWKLDRTRISRNLNRAALSTSHMSVLAWAAVILPLHSRLLIWLSIAVVTALTTLDRR